MASMRPPMLPVDPSDPSSDRAVLQKDLGSRLLNGIMVQVPVAERAMNHAAHAALSDVRDDADVSLSAALVREHENIRRSRVAKCDHAREPIWRDRVPVD